MTALSIFGVAIFLFVIFCAVKAIYEFGILVGEERTLEEIYGTRKEGST